MKTLKLTMQDIQNDDVNCFEELYKFYFKRLRGYAVKFTNEKEAANDIVNECFLKLWKSRKELECVNLEDYLFRMVKNKSLNYLESRQYKEDFEEHLLYEIEKQEALDFYNFSHNPENLYIVEELKKHIYSVIENFPEPRKTIFHLSRDEGLKNREIAAELGLAIKTIEYHLTIALNTLYKKLRNIYPEIKK